jgi:hypothetical protein
MADEAKIYFLSDLGEILEEKGKVRESLLRNHVNPTVHQDSFITHYHKDTASAYILSCS